MFDEEVLLTKYNEITQKPHKDYTLEDALVKRVYDAWKYEQDRKKREQEDLEEYLFKVIEIIPEDELFKGGGGIFLIIWNKKCSLSFGTLYDKN